MHPSFFWLRKPPRTVPGAEASSDASSHAAPDVEPDYYAVLGLPAGSPIESIRAQYRLLAKRHHPDLKGGGRFWQEHFKKINDAHDFLTEPTRKAAYDRRRTSAAPVAREAAPLFF